MVKREPDGTRSPQLGEMGTIRPSAQCLGKRTDVRAGGTDARSGVWSAECGVGGRRDLDRPAVTFTDFRSQSASAHVHTAFSAIFFAEYIGGTCSIAPRNEAKTFSNWSLITASISSLRIPHSALALPFRLPYQSKPNRPRPHILFIFVENWARRVAWPTSINHHAGRKGVERAGVTDPFCFEYSANAATTSCEVSPAGLSMIRMPFIYWRIRS